ncbi:hypothetical protein OF83DRAFT_251189 [Amylostereum chailletii]|nr:hypothetical protein OF83DRAFT_251189 [Amylostereum chailletii]
MADRAKRSDRLSALAQLKRARQGGKREWKGEEDTDIYDEVTEEQYKGVVAGRLAKDDFVVDDGVSGYMDNGMDDWGNGDASDDEDEEEDRRKAKSKKKKETDKAKSKAKPKAPPPVAPTMSAYRPAKSEDQEADFMSSLLGDMDSAPSVPMPRPRKRKPSPEYRSRDRPAYRSRDSLTDRFFDNSSDGPQSDGFDMGQDASSDDNWMSSPRKKHKTETQGITPATEKLNRIDMNASTDEEDYDAAFDSDVSMFMDIDEDVKPAPPKPKPFLSGTDKKPASNMLKKEEGNPSWLSVYDSLSVAPQESFGTLNGASTGASSSAAHAAKVQALQPDGSFQFFWLDYLEHEGVLYFIGKTLNAATNSYVSCCVTVGGLQRNLFVLPRQQQLDDEGYETDVVPGLQDVYTDFDQVRRKAGIKAWKAKFVKRKYAFGEAAVPREETQWLKVVYGFDEPQIPQDVTSPNFSRVFGTNTNAFELLVLKRKIMGPCWIQVKKPHVEYKGVVTVSDPKDFNPFSEADDNAPKNIPPLTIASLSVRTIVNHQENKREIVCASARIWSSIVLEDPTPPEALACRAHTFIRPLERYPRGFEDQAKANKQGNISPMKDERSLLNLLLVTLHKADPDVIVGHEFLGVSLDVLLHRMRELKVDHWSRMGRFRRSRWPNIGRQGTNLRFLNGRLLCDLASDGAKSMIASTTWSLTEMCKTHLKQDREDIDPEDTANYFDGAVSSPGHLMKFVRHCELDAHYHMAIASKVQILPLTKQLTNLAGNSWNKTLNGGRAERNEYILLHEFHRLKYVCPDKQWGKKAAPVKVEVEDDGEGGVTIGKAGKGKRDKYKGGLVLEPKRGLWDKFILVMDFNSLYPSIIQEYNIDFTTINKTEEEDEDGQEKIPEPPSSEVPQGVLPRIIATLVNRRRQVKSLMKDRALDPGRYLQYNIKQQALKLTANSMYGCLGFEYSRFYARPLAALTTFKGREILTHTKELAESLQLDVVYGDTDSLFVNSNVTELSEAMRISSEFKKAVNDRYKLLEIDLDCVFQRLLLLQKKKYAALKVEEGGSRVSTEVKGLDMKRREYSALSKSVSQYVLDQILSGEATEIVVERIHEYLTEISQDIRGGKVKLDEFIIFKRLGKAPEDYPDAKSQPHVQVALKMKARGSSTRAGDVIPYIFCEGDSSDTSKVSQADRARHPDELRRSSELKIDYEYYLAHQVLPPIERLCDPIEGTDRARLAECLGLDPGRYRTIVAGETEERAFGTLDSQVSDAERYREADPFMVRCRSCDTHTAFAHMSDENACLLKAAGAVCPSCSASISAPSLVVQLECQIRDHISRYYEAWTVCSDTTCGNRSRMMSVYGRRCLMQDCRGRVALEYTDAQLYNQLRYYAYLFDASKAGTSEFATGLVLTQRDLLRRLTQTVEKYLEVNGRRWVDMGSLFSFMKI